MSRYPFPSYPSGWFALSLSKDLGPDDVLTRQAFGQEVVLFRGSDGAPHLLGAYCPHMGAHLGKGGCVVDGTLRCPFHAFRFAGDGRCVSIPDVDKIPPAMKAEAFEVREVDGAVFVWHGCRGEGPSFEPPSYFDLRGTEGWTDMSWHTWERVAAHPQETSENSVDLAHFKHVHGYTDMSVVDALEVDGPTLRIGYTMARDLSNLGMPGQKVESIFRVRVHGLGYSVVEVSVPKFNTEFRTYVLSTPLDRDHVILRGGGIMKALPDANMSAMVEKLFFDGFVHDVEQDFAIWENKAYYERPLLAASDGPIGPYRKWARQFYAYEDDAVAAE
ncbi:MAG: Rieske 2Fe-2S domain-containing protein [Myxococcota bacterium]